jgi:hypothetical protein
MQSPPTDFKLLRAIYERHQNEYAAYVDGSRASPGFVPLDIDAIAKRLGVEPVSILGRLYYHLDRRGRKSFYTKAIGQDGPSINFPLLEAVLAGLWQQRRRDLWTLGVAIVSAGIAIAALVVSIVTAATA